MKKLFSKGQLTAGLLSFLLATGFLLPDAYSQKLPDGVVMNSRVEGITEYQLKNGLKVLLFPDQSKPTITVNITYLVGSRHEGYGETGMAHLLEHMVFKGTPKHPNIPQELTEHGARPNGTTWYDRTNYYETFNASEENLKWALDLESDRMINSYIAKKDLDSEMTVVRNEFESGENDPVGILMERVTSTAYLWHNYGQSTIGARSDIENVPIERLQAFYHKYYQPDNAVLLIAGKFDPEKTLALVDQYFSPIPVPDRTVNPLYKTYTKEPTQDGERSVVLKRVGDVQAVSCMYHTPPGAHEDFPAVAVLEEVLTNEPSGRLYKALVESKKASNQWGFTPALAEGGFAYFNAEVRKESSLEDAQNILLATLDDLGNNPPTTEEVDRAKSRLLKNWNLAFNDANRVGLFLSEYIAQGDWRLLFLYRDRLESVTPEDVATIAKKYFKPSNRTVGTFTPVEKPDRAEIPDAPDVAALVQDYKGRAEIAMGEEFDPSPENIAKRTEKMEAAAGLEYALLPKETRGDAVAARITLRFGDLNSLKGKSTVAGLTASLLDKGTATKTRQQIQDELDRLKARVRIGGGVNNVNVTIETERDKLPETINLVMEMLKKPAFSKEEFDKLVEEELAGIEAQRSEPEALADNTFDRLMRPYPADDPRYTKTFDEEAAALKSVKVEDVRQFYKDFYGASDATVAVVGDFEKDEIKKAILASLKDWKSPRKFSRIPDEYKDVSAIDKKINTPDKANALFLAGQNLAVRDDDPDYPALVLGNFMLGGGFLNSRLATRIRQQEGISYGVGSWFSAGSLDESGMFGSYAIYAPENLSRLETAYKEEIEKMLKDGFTAEEVAAAKAGWLQSQVVNRAQDSRLVGTLNNNLYINRDITWDAELEKKIQALTPQQIQAAMKKYIKPEKFVFVKAGDFEKVEKEGKP